MTGVLCALRQNASGLSYRVANIVIETTPKRRRNDIISVARVVTHIFVTHISVMSAVYLYTWRAVHEAVHDRIYDEDIDFFLNEILGQSQ